MKISKPLFNDIAQAIDNVLSTHNLTVICAHRQNVKFANNQFIAFCWSIFHASKYNVSLLYDAGLNDTHIETALKRILSDFE